jgi:Tfp pilus assembly protein PilF
MSLINDYLKKTQDEAPPLEQPGDVPPLLKSSGKGGGGKLAIRISVIAVLGLIAGVVYYSFQSSMEKTTPPPELVASLNEGPLHYPVVQSKAPATASATRTAEDPSKTGENFPAAEAIAAVSEEETAQPAPPETITTAEKPAAPEPRTEAVVQEPARTIATKPEVAEMPSPQPRNTIQVAQASPPVRVAPIKKPEEHKTVEVDLNHYFQIGLLAQKEGDFQEAAKFYREVLVQDPAHMGALINLAAVYIHQKKTTDAEKILRKILRIDPKNTKALVNLGVINLAFNQREQARIRFQEALQIDPREETALINLAFLANQEDNTSLAEKCYKDILSIDPENVEVLLAYASLLEKNSRFAEALSWYQKSLEVPAVIENDQLNNRVRDRIDLLMYYSSPQR